jgi:hypothetical protein
MGHQCYGCGRGGSLEPPGPATTSPPNREIPATPVVGADGRIPVVANGWTTRPETPGDVTAVGEVNLAAFPTAAEAALVDALRASDARIEGLSIVTKDDEGTVVGHALLTADRRHRCANARFDRHRGSRPVGVSSRRSPVARAGRGPGRSLIATRSCAADRQCTATGYEQSPSQALTREVVPMRATAANEISCSSRSVFIRVPDVVAGRAA